MKFNPPSNLTNQETLELLTQEIPGISNLTVAETGKIDTQGSNEWEYNRNAPAAYYYKIIAARAYQLLANKEKKQKQRNYLNRQAAICYSKASKDAVSSGYLMAAIRCRIRACRIDYDLYKIYEKAGDREKKEFHKESLFYSRAHLEAILTHPKTRTEDLEQGILWRQITHNKIKEERRKRRIEKRYKRRLY